MFDAGIRLSIWALAWYVIVGELSDKDGSFLVLLLLGPAWILAGFVRAFFNVALAHGLTLPQDDEHMLDNSLIHAGAMKWQIFKWSIIQGVVHWVVQSNSGGLFRQMIASLGQMSWKLGTLLTPVYLSRGLGPMASIDQSIKTISLVFGTSAMGTAGIWGVFYLAQGAISFAGFFGIWACVMKGHPIGGVAVGFAAALLVLGVRVYEQAVSTAFAVKLFQHHQADQVTNN